MAFYLLQNQAYLTGQLFCGIGPLVMVRSIISPVSGDNELIQGFICGICFNNFNVLPNYGRIPVLFVEQVYNVILFRSPTFSGLSRRESGVVGSIYPFPI